jgi:hypothetical protein
VLKKALSVLYTEGWVLFLTAVTHVSFGRYGLSSATDSPRLRGRGQSRGEFTDLPKSRKGSGEILHSDCRKRAPGQCSSSGVR